MIVPLATHRISRQWLRQFRRDDFAAAEALLNSLRLVPFAEFEEAIAIAVRNICDKTAGRLAVFPVDKDFDGTSRRPSSAAKIGYTLTNLERVIPRRVRVQPSEESMRKEKVKHIVLVDDVFATGSRITRFWNRWATKTLKSWLSYHACELWIVAFAAHECGIERILDRVTYLDRQHIRTTLALPSVANYPNSAIYRVCDEYGKSTGKSGAARGVGGTMSPVIFQHGCPNNAPAILWASGKGWRGLFPDRGIPPELYPCFGDVDDGTRNAEILWDAGQYRLALEILNAAQYGKKSRNYQLLLAVLGLLARRMAVADLPQLMTVSAARIQTAIGRAQKWGLVDNASKLTPFGLDILARVRRSSRSDDVTVHATAYAIDRYYPFQYFGVQRKSSNEPA